MRIPSPIWRRAAALAVALGMAASLALATPAAAQDDRFPAPGKDLFKVLCALFGGIYHEYKDVGVYVCQFTTGDVTCDGTECWVVVPLKSPPLKDECDSADGEYGQRGEALFSCELKEGTLMFECVDDKRQWRCAVGWVTAKDPEEPPR